MHCDDKTVRERWIGYLSNRPNWEKPGSSQYTLIAPDPQNFSKLILYDLQFVEKGPVKEVCLEVTDHNYNTCDGIRSNFNALESGLIDCFLSHPDFSGRTTELAILKNTFLSQRKPSDETRFFFLHGLGGMGKSELAIRFANIHQEEFSLIWFFPASNDVLLREKYKKLAKKLEIPFSEKETLEILQKRVHDCLESTPFQYPYLLIFDNIEKKTDPQMFPQRGGAVLMTSREKSHWRDVHTMKRIEEFKEKDDALTLIKEITQEEVTSEMRDLADKLGYIPFLLDQVAHFIQAQETTISEYLQYFDFKQEAEVSIDERYNKTFKTVWEVTFEKLEQEDSLTLEWLKVCAFLHPDNIPVQWLEEWLKDKNVKDPPKERIQALGTLSKYALIRERQSGIGPISLHRLLQQALQSKVEDPTSFLLNVYRFIKKHSKNFDYKNGNHRWVPHGEKILEIVQGQKLSSDEIKQEIYRYLGIAYYSLGEYQQALEYHLKHLAIAEKLGDQESLARPYANLGIAYYPSGEYRTALDYHKRDLEIVKKLGDQKGMGRAYNNIGLVYLFLGEYQQTLEYHQKRLEIAEKLDDQESLARAYSGIGLAYLFLGKYRTALDCHLKHLEVAEKLNNQGSIAKAYGNIGLAYHSLEEYRTALDYHLKHLAIAEKLGDQGGVGSAYSGIGLAYHSLEEYRTALDYHLKRLEIAEKLGDQGGVGSAYGNIGSAYQALGNYQQALEYHLKHLAIAEKLGDQGSLGKAFSGIGFSYDHLGEYQKAKNYYEKALTIAKKIGYLEVEKFAEAKLAELESRDSWCTIT